MDTLRTACNRHDKLNWKNYLKCRSSSRVHHALTWSFSLFSLPPGFPAVFCWLLISFLTLQSFPCLLQLQLRNLDLFFLESLLIHLSILPALWYLYIHNNNKRQWIGWRSASFRGSTISHFLLLSGASFVNSSRSLGIFLFLFSYVRILQKPSLNMHLHCLNMQ